MDFKLGHYRPSQLVGTKQSSMLTLRSFLLKAAQLSRVITPKNCFRRIAFTNDIYMSYIQSQSGRPWKGHVPKMNHIRRN